MKDKFPYLQMVKHLYNYCLEDCDEWSEKFIRSLKIQLELHPDYENLTEEEVKEFLSEAQKEKLIEIWSLMGF
jgi:hypothetical protein